MEGYLAGYRNLSKEQQSDLLNTIAEKIKSLLGVHGDTEVLAEYIVVMLQSDKAPEYIEHELQAFLQEQSQPFVTWLAESVEAMTARKAKPAKERRKSRRVAEATAVPAAPAPVAPAKEKRKRAASPTHAKKERRSRSRRRRRRETETAGVAVARVAASAAEADNENAAGKASRSIQLTPNVQFLRDAYHHKVDTPDGEAPGQAEIDASKWHFRAEPLSPLSAPPQAHVAPARHPPGEFSHGQYGSPYGAPRSAHSPYEPAPAPIAPTRPMKTIAPKKWKVTRKNTIVRETEQLNSAEVRSLNEGEIVEQVSPSMTIMTPQGGIVRILIRHPSSPQFPNPIGWVTLDATGAGGPKFLEPGPEPMSRGKPWAPPVGTRNAVDFPAAGASTPRPAWGSPAASPPVFAAAVAQGARPPAAPPVPAAARGPRGTFQNLTWTPS